MVQQNQVHLVLHFLMIREGLLANSLVDTPNAEEIKGLIIMADFINLGLEEVLHLQGFPIGWILRGVKKNSLMVFIPMS